MQPIRVGAVNYLNTKPLIEGLTEFDPSIELSLALPSRLADQMTRGELEVGLIPVVEFLRAERYSYIPNISISSHGPVLSVTLFSRVPWNAIHSVSLDEGSRTSAALTRILLERRHKLKPHYRQLPIDQPAENLPTDAVLLIGDRAMKACLPGFEYAYDLGQEWQEWTGYPMVFAVWAVQDGVDLGTAEQAFARAKQLGRRHVGAIAAREAATLGLDPGFCRRYLTNIIRYDLGTAELAGYTTIINWPLISTSHHEARSMSNTIDRILSKVNEGQRISYDEGVELMVNCHDVNRLGRAAHAVTMRLHPEPYRTYNIDRNINYTNVCAAVCDFCAFYRKSHDADAYVISRDDLHEKIRETIALGGDQILLQGGMHPSLKLEWYEEMLADLRTHFPTVNLHAFSPPEIWHFHKVNKIPLRSVLERLKAAGLGSIPGGGGEILVDRVRKVLTKGKALTDEWLAVMREWHQLGGKSTCTMMFGHIETLQERVEHLHRLRELQDKTGGFTAFICWTMQPGHKMADAPAVGSFEYLRVQAISRLYLDNIPNIQSSWVTQGGKIGQIALFYGANDMGSLMIEENVVASAGTVHCLTLDEIKRSIRDAGWEPRQRNVFYELIDRPEPSVVPAKPSRALPIVV